MFYNFCSPQNYYCTFFHSHQQEQELKKKNNELKLLGESYSRIVNWTEGTSQVSQKSLSNIKKSLMKERTLKKMAFQKVDILRTMVSKFMYKSKVFPLRN